MIDQRILDAYFAYAEERSRAGILDCWTDALDDRPVEDVLVEKLRAAGRLPEGWEQS